MVKYKFVLSAYGRKHFKGGNRVPMKKPLGKTFPTKEKAERHLMMTLGSTSRSLYNLKKIE